MPLSMKDCRASFVILHRPFTFTASSVSSLIQLYSVRCVTPRICATSVVVNMMGNASSFCVFRSSIVTSLTVLCCCFRFVVPLPAGSVRGFPDPIPQDPQRLRSAFPLISRPIKGRFFPRRCFLEYGFGEYMPHSFSIIPDIFGAGCAPALDPDLLRLRSPVPEYSGMLNRCRCGVSHFLRFSENIFLKYSRHDFQEE